jgi:multidrug efflux pump subunit AcrA (membrane-fusion protein)
MKKLTLIFILTLFLAACGQDVEPEVKSEPKIEKITLEAEKTREEFSLVGSLEANREVPLSVKSQGRLASLIADVGDQVTEGQVLAFVSADESEVNLATAQKNQQNLENLFISQSKFFDDKIAQAEKAVEIAEQSLAALGSTQKTTASLGREQVASAKKNKEQAEQALENVKNINKTRFESAYSNADTAIRTGLIAGVNMVNFADDLLGVSDNKDSFNDSFDTFLGFKEPDTKIEAIISLKKALEDEKEKREFYEEKLKNGGIANDEYDQYTADMIKYLESLQVLAKDIQELLNASVVGGLFTSEKLQGFKSQNLSLASIVESSLISQEGSGLKSLQSQIGQIKTQNQAELSQAQKSLESANQGLIQASAGSNKADVDMSSQKEILKKQVEQAKVSLASTKSQKESALKELKTQIDLIKGNKELAETLIFNSTLTAPFDGVITEKKAELGKVVNPSEPILMLADVSSYKIRTEIADINASKVYLGNEAEVSFDGVSGVYNAKITKIDPKINSNTKNLGLELELDNLPSVLRIGLFARIRLFSDEEDAYFVPRKFVIFKDQKTYLKTESGDIEVKIGSEYEEKVKVWFDGQMQGAEIFR